MIRHARMRGHADAVPARPRPRVHRRPVRARRDPRQGRREPPDARPRAVPRADARLQRLDEAGHARAAATGRGPRSTGAGCATPWTRARPRRSAWPSTRLYRDGLAYRTEALVNWCPGCRTSVSDLEVISTPETGTLWSIRYHLIDEATGEPDPAPTITVATTRPETILGDTAVAVHPDDARYAGARRAARADPVRRPRRADHRRRGGRAGLRDRGAQDHARPTTTTTTRPACATTCPPSPSSPTTRPITEHGHGLRRPRPLRGAAPDRRRPRGTAATSSASAAHEMVIGHCQRSDDVIEPRLKTQWFIRTRPLAAAGARRHPVGPDPDPARTLREDLGALAHRASATGT